MSKQKKDETLREIKPKSKIRKISNKFWEYFFLYPLKKKKTYLLTLVFKKVKFHKTMKIIKILLQIKIKLIFNNHKNYLK